MAFWNLAVVVTLPEERCAILLKDEIVRIERGFWTGGEDYFRNHLDETCMLAFHSQTPLEEDGT